MSPTLTESAALAGGHCWAERRLFEVLGRWSAEVGAPAATLVLDRHSQHAAWRAAQWWDRLPVLAGVERDELVVPAAGWASWAGTAGPGAAGALGPVAVLAVTYRVLLPRLVVGYARHAAVTSPASDGPVVRTLAQVRADAAADWAAGEDVLQALLPDAASVEEAAAAAAATERHFAT